MTNAENAKSGPERGETRPSRAPRLARLPLRLGPMPRPRTHGNALATKDVGALHRHISA